MPRLKEFEKQQPYAEAVMDAFGGPSEFARMYAKTINAKFDRTTPHKWIARGGRVPDIHHSLILRCAKENGIKLDPSKLGPRRKESDAAG